MGVKRPAAKKAKAKAPTKRPAAKVDHQYVLVGSYTAPHGHVQSKRIEEAKGISVFRREKREVGFGELVFHSSSSDFPCPTYLCCNAAKTRVYAVSETPDEGTVAAYAFNARTGQLKLLNSQATGGAIGCHVALSSDETLLAVACYGGCLALFPLTVEGRLAARSELVVSESLGVGPDRERQQGPHPHMVHFDRENQHLLVPDLGLDRVLVYSLQKNSLKSTKQLTLPPGSGPRHLVFHPHLEVVYVLNELLSTVVTCRYESGELAAGEPQPTVDDARQSSTAAVRITGDGRFLYASNRGHDSITAFEIALDGSLKLLKQHPTSALGVLAAARWPPEECPRDFALCDGERYVIVANQNSDTLVVLERDALSGTLSHTGVSTPCAAPACVLPLF